MITVIIPTINEEENIASGHYIAFCSKDELINHHADIVIQEPSFAELLNLMK